MDTALGSFDGIAIFGWLVLSSGPAMFRRDSYGRCKGCVGCRGGVSRYQFDPYCSSRCFRLITSELFGKLIDKLLQGS
jgi:hypothetical protein